MSALEHGHAQSDISLASATSTRGTQASQHRAQRRTLVEASTSEIDPCLEAHVQKNVVRSVVAKFRSVRYMSLRVAPTSIDDADEKGMASELTCPTETNLILQPIVVTNRKGLNHRASNAISERSSRFMNVQSAGIAQTLAAQSKRVGQFRPL